MSLAGHCTALLTESRELTGPRQIVGMAVTERAAEVESLVLDFLDRFERQSPGIVGVDLQDRRLVEVVKANLGVDAQRALGRAQAAATTTRIVPPPVTTFLPPDIEVPRALPARADLRLEEPYHAPPTSPGDTRLCPDCAETIKQAAIRCRFCGYRFSPAAPA